MIPRAAIFTVRELAKFHPFVAITGPRQSGKSTLIRAAFPDKPRISLEEPDIREFASSSPGDFLDHYPDGAIFDEAQRSPGLLSHILNLTDRDDRKGLYILSGPLPSFFISEITKAQEVRIGILHLLPLSISELTEVGELPAYIDELLYKGMYPPLYDSSITLQPGIPVIFQTSWIVTYGCSSTSANCRCSSASFASAPPKSAEFSTSRRWQESAGYPTTPQKRGFPSLRRAI